MSDKNETVKKIYQKLSRKLLDNLKDKEAAKKRKIFFIFLILATIFWFLNALDGEYTTQIKYPIKFINLPKNKVLTSETIKYVDLKISASGYDILNIKSKIELNALIIDINRNKLHQISEKDTFINFLLTGTFLSQINKQVSQNIEVLAISPDSVIFNFSEEIKKKIPVSAEFNIKCKKMYMISGKIEIKPDSIEISGLKEDVKLIAFAQPEQVEFLNVEKSITEKITLKNNKGIKINPQEVTINIPIEKYTEKKIRVPIKILNLPDTINLKIFPDIVNLTFKVPLSLYEKTGIKDFDISVDYKETSKLKSNKMTLKINKQPENINDLKIGTHKIDYIVEIKLQ